MIAEKRFMIAQKRPTIVQKRPIFPQTSVCRWRLCTCCLALVCCHCITTLHYYTTFLLHYHYITTTWQLLYLLLLLPLDRYVATILLHLIATTLLLQDSCMTATLLYMSHVSSICATWLLQYSNTPTTLLLHNYYMTATLLLKTPPYLLRGSGVMDRCIDSRSCLR